MCFVKAVRSLLSRFPFDFCLNLAVVLMRHGNEVQKAELPPVKLQLPPSSEGADQTSAGSSFIMVLHHLEPLQAGENLNPWLAIWIQQSQYGRVFCYVLDGLCWSLLYLLVSAECPCGL